MCHFLSGWARPKSVDVICTFDAKTHVMAVLRSSASIKAERDSFKGLNASVLSPNTMNDAVNLETYYYSS